MEDRLAVFKLIERLVYIAYGEILFVKIFLIVKDCDGVSQHVLLPHIVPCTVVDDLPAVQVFVQFQRSGRQFQTQTLVSMSLSCLPCW